MFIILNKGVGEMRDIKFRGKRTDSGDWAYGYLVKYPIVAVQIMEYEDSPRKWYFHDVENDSVGQYTGLKDMNGVDIYEGDIISFDSNTSIVFYNSSHCAFMLADGGSRGRGYLRLGQLSSLNIEVIGNRYENLD